MRTLLKAQLCPCAAVCRCPHPSEPGSGPKGDPHAGLRVGTDSVCAPRTLPSRFPLGQAPQPRGASRSPHEDGQTLHRVWGPRAAKDGQLGTAHAWPTVGTP